jgi:hypothetical protein
MDHTARLWDLMSGQCLYVFDGHMGPVTELKFTPDGRQLATVAGSRVLFWDLSSRELRGMLHLVEEGLIRTTPPDEVAPFGWLWTDREDLVHLVERNHEDGRDPQPIVPDDERFREYMLAFNRQDMVMSRISKPARYQQLAARHLAIVQGIEEQKRQVRVSLLPAPDRQ